MSKSKVLNLKDKISGNEADLSLCNLSEVPARELASFPKATVVDLSCNNIISLPLKIKRETLTFVFQVLQHMRALQEEFDRAREKRLLKEKELEKKREAKQREREAREREARKREKAEEKERRRKEYNAQMAALAAKEQQKKKSEEKKKKNGQAADKKVDVKPAAKPQRSLIGLIFKLLLLLTLGLAGAAAACRLTDLQKEDVCVAINAAVDDCLSWAKVQEGVARQLLYNLSSAAKDLLESTQTSKN
ncbi:PREDICTED: leucine-rich repeat-containing protein 59 [Cyprinodon variegatus]|uniref:leucine-rich repeat-containing protein 59 n=1 Tax=Cyprinodon variegatus TaxID=28743 RepID=UPI0007426EDB|nr:PREDICTED: leucine-rich repeat-containing protein 59 [Cyprinodon variegatus]